MAIVVLALACWLWHCGREHRRMRDLAKLLNRVRLPPDILLFLEHKEQEFFAAANRNQLARRNKDATLMTKQIDESRTTFRDTHIPLRVVTTFRAESIEDLSPELRATLLTWTQDPHEQRVQLVYYSDADCLRFLEQHYPPVVAEAWAALIPGAYRADLFRYAEIFLNGGVWIDVKNTRLAPFSTFLHANSALGALVLEPWGTGLWNGLFAAPPGAPWLAHALRRTLKNVIAQAYPSSKLDISGPTVLCRGVRDWLLRAAPQLVQQHCEDPEAFSSCGSCEAMRSQVGVLETLGVHLLALSSVTGKIYSLQNDTHNVPVAHSVHMAYRRQRGKATPENHYPTAFKKRLVYKA